MKFICFLACCLAAFSALGTAPGEQSEEGALSLRIVPTVSREDGVKSIILSQPAEHFHVVVTNVSDEPVRLWREWCSWGYHSLSFEIRNEDGSVTVVEKAPRSWRKNFPDWTTIPPGDHMVFEVSFDPQTWQNAPLPEKGESRRVTMKAVFEIAEDKDTEEHKVWTGRVSSPEHVYVIYG